MEKNKVQNTPTTNKKLIEWVNRMAKLCGPDKIVWIDGSEEQKLILEKECVASGELIRLNPEKLPGCFLHRTAQDDVARTSILLLFAPRKNTMPARTITGCPPLPLTVRPGRSLKTR